MTFTSLRDAGAERLTDSGAQLLGAVVATPGLGLHSSVHGADRRGTAFSAAVPAIGRDLAEGLD